MELSAAYNCICPCSKRIILDFYQISSAVQCVHHCKRTRRRSIDCPVSSFDRGALIVGEVILPSMNASCMHASDIRPVCCA